MQLNSSLSSRIRNLEGEVEGLKRQMKDKEDKDRRKEEWFPSLVAFIVRNLNSEHLSGVGAVPSVLSAAQI